MGFCNSKGDSFLFIKFSSGHFGICWWILLIGSISEIIDQLIVDIFKDLGVFKYFLGMKVNYFHDCINFSKMKYIRDLLNVIGLIDSMLFTIPMSLGTILDKFDGSHLTNVMAYRKLVSSLQYLTMIRSDISFVINKLCQFMSSPTDSH